MTVPLLTRDPHRRPAHPALPFLGDLALTRGRAHELCGPARRTLAAMIAARTEGPVFWIAPSWGTDRLNAEAALRFLDPGRLVFLRPKRAEDLLWSMEEVLRAGAVALTVAELPDPPGLTPVRRLHLAAETGAAEGRLVPLGLLLTPGDGGAPGVETRWHMGFAHGADGAEAWRLERRRARTAPQKAWTVRPEAHGFRVEAPGAGVVPAEGQVGPDG